MAVQFDERPLTSARPRSIKRSLISGLIINMGLAKTEEGAKLIEIVLLILLLAAIFFTVSATGKNPPEPPTAQEIIP